MTWQCHLLIDRGILFDVIKSRRFAALNINFRRIVTTARATFNKLSILRINWQFCRWNTNDTKSEEKRFLPSSRKIYELNDGVGRCERLTRIPRFTCGKSDEKNHGKLAPLNNFPSILQLNSSEILQRVIFRTQFKRSTAVAFPFSQRAWRVYRSRPTPALCTSTSRKNSQQLCSVGQAKKFLAKTLTR